ncbi:hypothetical protein JKY72_04775 [Candidatus Gracilibacteria bacterium]|nr:hypothetical protein [Candidatus Gracilibacteria bacterium]
MVTHSHVIALSAMFFCFFGIGAAARMWKKTTTAKNLDMWILWLCASVFTFPALIRGFHVTIFVGLVAVLVLARPLTHPKMRYNPHQIPEEWHQWWAKTAVLVLILIGACTIIVELTFFDYLFASAASLIIMFGLVLFHASEGLKRESNWDLHAVLIASLVFFLAADYKPMGNPGAAIASLVLIVGAVLVAGNFLKDWKLMPSVRVRVGMMFLAMACYHMGKASLGF